MRLVKKGVPAIAVALLVAARAAAQFPAERMYRVVDLVEGAGKPAEAAEHLKKAVDLGSSAPPLIYNLACAYALTGRKDDAFARLTEVAGTGWLTREQVEGDADLASLKSDPRFAALLAKLPGARRTALRAPP